MRLPRRGVSGYGGAPKIRPRGGPRRSVPDARSIPVAAIATQGVAAVIAFAAVVGAEVALVVVLANLGGRVQGVTGTAGQKSNAGVATDGVVATLTRKTVVLELTLVYVDASQGQLVATVAG